MRQNWARQGLHVIDSFVGVVYTGRIPSPMEITGRADRIVPRGTRRPDRPHIDHSPLLSRPLPTLAARGVVDKGVSPGVLNARSRSDLSRRPRNTFGERD